MKTSFFKVSKSIALAMMLFIPLSLFTACGSDDDDDNTVKINGQETNVLSMTATETGEEATIMLTIASVDKNSPKLNTLTFTLPIKDYGKKIECENKGIGGSIFNNDFNLNKGSHFQIDKKDNGNYKVTFQLAQTLMGGSTTTVAGTYEGKPLSADASKL